MAAPTFGVALLLLAAAASSKVELGPISLGDLLFGAAATWAGGWLALRRGLPESPRWLRWQLAIVVWSMVGVFLLAVFSLGPLGGASVTGEWARSMARYIFFVTASTSIAGLLASGRRKLVLRAVRWATVALAGSGVLLFVIRIGRGATTSLSHLIAGPDGGIEERLAAPGSTFPRAQGIMSEPSVYSSLLAILVMILFTAGRRRGGWPATETSIILLAVTAIVLAFSPSGILILAVGLLGSLADYGVRARGGRETQVFGGRRWTSMLLGGLLVVVLAVTAGRPMLTTGVESLALRASAIADGRDGSADARLRASWEVPLDMLSESPLLGVGLGNLNPTVEARANSLRWYQYLRNEPDAWSTFAWVLGSLGLIGFGLFLGSLWSLSRAINLGVALPIVALLWGSAAYLEPMFWAVALISVVAVPSERRANRQSFSSAAAAAQPA